MELQDFHVKLHIVADSVRKNEYLDKLKSSAFEPIQQRVEFLDYDTLAQRHTLLSQLTMLGR